MAKTIKLPGMLEPVAVALETIEVDGAVLFNGIDLETGLKIQISVDRGSALAALSERRPPRTLSAHGLVLMLNIEQIGADA